MDFKPSSIARPLTKEEAKEVCRVGGIPERWHARFAQAVERCVASYERVRNRKSASEVEEELMQVQKRVQRCLKLCDHKKWRPGEFQKGLKAVSVALAGLSPYARDFLQFRNVRIVHVLPNPWPQPVGSEIVVDPMCFHDQDDQIDALCELRGALTGAADKRKRGRARKDAERALSHCLGVAYTRDTKKMASDKSPKFMDVCEEIKQIYQLEGWSAESLPRSARKLRAQDKQEE